jgi:hypothetical protein
LGYTEEELARRLTSALAVGVDPSDPHPRHTVLESIEAGKAAPRDLPAALHEAAMAARGGSDRNNGDSRRRYTAAEAAEINAMLPPGAEPVKEGDPCPNQEGRADRIEIEVNTRRHEVVAQAITCLPRDPTLYRRCERLVTVVEDVRTRVKITRRTAVRQQEKTPRIITLSTAVIGMVLTRNADWFQWKKDPEGEFIAVAAHPPDWAIKAVETIGHWPGVRFLRAVAEAPFIRPDGTVVSATGYDPDTETLLIPSGKFPAIPDRPTKADAKAAVKQIFALVAQFPFVDDNHKLVWLAALLTVIGRPAITGPCPGFVFDANVAGTGKTLLATIIGLIATGRDVATVGYPQEPTEMGKIVTSVALAGYPVVLLDNVPNGSKFGNDQLDRALTSTTVDGRELGKSRMVGMLDLSSVWLLTGNNNALTGFATLCGRCVGMEAPALKTMMLDKYAALQADVGVGPYRREAVFGVPVGEVSHLPPHCRLEECTDCHCPVWVDPHLLSGPAEEALYICPGCAERASEAGRLEAVPIVF